MNFFIRKYEPEDFDSLFNIVHKTIAKIYPRYYNEESVRFFHDYHCADNIGKDTASGHTLVAIRNDHVIGTGHISGHEIKRMFVLPGNQSSGCGKMILKELELFAMKNGKSKIVLHASSGAFGFYVKNGYSFNEYKILKLDNENCLPYIEMSRYLNPAEEYEINYDNRVFTTIENSSTGEVGASTVFRYRQNRESVWAEYTGGKIRKGFLIGTSKKNGALSFVYSHLNDDNEIRTGKCISNPQILPDGRIRLYESWQWTNGDLSRGESIIEEIKS
jgi:GNAT superfamily N-acetyltransferase